MVTLVAILVASCGSSTIEKGTTCIRLGDYPMAIRFFTHALEHDPGSFEARVGMGKALLQKAVAEKGDKSAWQEAILHLEAAATLGGNDAEIPLLLSEVWFARAQNLVARKDTSGALDALSRSIEDDPGNPSPVNLAAIIYFRAGYTDKAEALFRKSVELDSAHPSSRFNLGMVLWSKGEYEEARKQWLLALKADPEDQDIIYWFAMAEKKLRERQ